MARYVDVTRQDRDSGEEREDDNLVPDVEGLLRDIAQQIAAGRSNTEKRRSHTSRRKTSHRRVTDGDHRAYESIEAMHLEFQQILERHTPGGFLNEATFHGLCAICGDHFGPRTPRRVAPVLPEPPDVLKKSS
jgi:hypothetical protein